MRVHLHGMTADGQWRPIIVGEQGFGLAGGSSGAPSASPLVQGWSYVAASGGIENTSDVTLKAASGVKKYNYLTALQIINADTSVGTEVVVKDGSTTVLWRSYLPPMPEGAVPAPMVVTFPQPLVGSNNTALTFAAITNGALVYVNAQGYVSGAPNQVELETNTVNEIYNRNGDLVTDRAGATIYARSF